MRVPFLPMPLDRARKASRRYLGMGETLSRFFPALDSELEKSNISLEAREWMAIAFFGFMFWFQSMFAMLFVISIAAKVALTTALGISLGLAFILGFLALFYISLYPKLMLGRKNRELEKHLPAALHHLLIHVRSGVPLFEALVSIANAGYGTLSLEFRKAVNEIETGKSEIAALELMARMNPSLYFRRILWQLVNSMKSGADIGNTVKQIVDALTADQKTAIKKYGAELNPLALFYMMLVVIFPTLGIVFLLVLFSFVGASISISTILVGILLFLLLVQFMFIGMFKSRRPVGI